MGLFFDLVSIIVMRSYKYRIVAILSQLCYPEEIVRSLIKMILVCYAFDRGLKLLSD